jgi:hypothetical protein
LSCSFQTSGVIIQAMTSKKSESSPRDWEYYQETFRELFEEFTRDVLVDQADHYMNMVGFTPGSSIEGT